MGARRTRRNTADEVGNVLVATETFVTSHDGERVTIRKGKTHVRAGHPIAEANPNRFRPVDVHYDVETARVEPPAPPAGGGASGRRQASSQTPTPPAAPTTGGTQDNGNPDA